MRAPTTCTAHTWEDYAERTPALCCVSPCGNPRRYIVIGEGARRRPLPACGLHLSRVVAGVTPYGGAAGARVVQG